MAYTLTPWNRGARVDSKHGRCPRCGQFLAFPPQDRHFEHEGE